MKRQIARKIFGFGREKIFGRERKGHVLWLIGRLLLVVVGIFFALMFIKMFGSLLKTGVEAMCMAWSNMDGETIRMTNYFAMFMHNGEFINWCLEALWLTIPLYLLADFIIKKVKFSLNSMIAGIFVFAIVFEVANYLSYFVQFAVDALYSAITSQEASLLLKNTISWRRWLQVDGLSRACEAFVLVFTISLFKRTILKYRRKLEEERKIAKEMEEEELYRQQEREERRERKRWRDMTNEVNKPMKKGAKLISD